MPERLQARGSGDLYLRLSGICFLISEMGWRQCRLHRVTVRPNRITCPRMMC